MTLDLSAMLSRTWEQEKNSFAGQGTVGPHFLDTSPTASTRAPVTDAHRLKAHSTTWQVCLLHNLCNVFLLGVLIAHQHNSCEGTLQQLWRHCA